MDEDELFTIEFVKSLKVDSNTFRDWTNLPFRVTLMGINLKERYGEEILPYQSTGYLFEPLTLISTADHILNGERVMHTFGDGSHIPLLFVPVQHSEKYNVMLGRDKFNSRVIGFDPETVRPFTVCRKNTAFQFYNAYNDLYWLAIKAGSEWAENELRACQEELANNQEVQELFRKRSVVFYHCEDKLREI